MSTAVSNPQAGASPSFTLVAEPARPQRARRRMTYDLPAGLVGDLALRGLTQCPLANADAGTCPRRAESAT